MTLSPSPHASMRRPIRSRVYFDALQWPKYAVEMNRPHVLAALDMLHNKLISGSANAADTCSELVYVLKRCMTRAFAVKHSPPLRLPLGGTRTVIQASVLW
jgi:hypothetical protein